VVQCGYFLPELLWRVDGRKRWLGEEEGDEVRGGERGTLLSLISLHPLSHSPTPLHLPPHPSPAPKNRRHQSSNSCNVALCAMCGVTSMKSVPSSRLDPTRPDTPKATAPAERMRIIM
jgi:hypothetical protein